MITRTADDVWTEIADRCRRLLTSGTPLSTLSREVPNWITAVGEREIRRRSESPQGNDEDSPVAFGEVAAIWRELTQHGETADVHVLRFTYALVGRLIEGIQYEPHQPFRLVVVVDEEAADRRWLSQGLEQPELGQAHDQLLKAIHDLRVYRDGDVRAPHKPLLLLLVLARYVQGTARRSMTFTDIEPQLRDLIGQFSSLSPEVEPQEPFWRLKSSGVWQIQADGELDVQSSSPPGLQFLREHQVRGGFDSLTDRALWSDPTLADDAVDRLLAAHFPPAAHAALRAAVGLPCPGSDVGPSPHEAVAAAETDIHILLRWQPAQNPNTVTEHREPQPPSKRLLWPEDCDWTFPSTGHSRRHWQAESMSSSPGLPAPRRPRSLKSPPTWPGRPGSTTGSR